MNPADLSTHLVSLFPPGAVVAELRTPGDPALLLPAEAAHLGRAVPKRAQEFAAGRLCARRALAEFGIVDFPVRVAADRQPLWPELLVGSITHTAGFCAAVVAERRRFSALGLDSEVVADVHAEIWPSIAVPAEIAWILSLPTSQHAAAAALIFSAKEAFYKCQFPMTRERLDFRDVTVEAPGWGLAAAVFNLRATRRLALLDPASRPLQGRYLFHEGFVSAGLALKGAAGEGGAQ
jgi:4'-phosphopantetheinyl transferase EntD